MGSSASSSTHDALRAPLRPSVVNRLVDTPAGATHPGTVMARRLASLLLSAVLALAGLTVGPCPDGRCAMQAAPAMDCCPTGGLHEPSCCPPVDQLGQRSLQPAGSERPLQAVALAAGLPVPPAIAAPPAAAAVAPRAVVGTAAPPGTLIAQHTSLLL